MLKSRKRINKDVTKEYLQRTTMHAKQWFLHFASEGEELLDFIL